MAQLTKVLPLGKVINVGIVDKQELRRVYPTKRRF